MRALFSIAAALFVAAAAAQPAGERLLFDNPDYDVLVAEDYYCEQPVRLTVRSKIPELFESDSPELQRIVDGARAVLSFECPSVRGVELEGVLAGLDEPVYFGVAGPDSGWTLTTKQSIQSEEYGAYQPPADGGPASPGGDGYTVASLASGMTVDEARAAAADTFGVEPAYDARTGVLSMQAGGCPADYDWDAMSPPPEPGWKCLQAWFTDQRRARLYLMDLVQVIRATDPDAVERRLVERFGEPAARGSRERGGWGDETPTIRTIGWGQVVEAGDGEQPDVHNLQAQILPVEGATVVTVTLYEPGLQPRRAGEPQPDAPDLTL